MSAPNWYPDPGGTELWRWFDGTKWTEHTQPPPQTQAVTQPASQPYVPAPATFAQQVDPYPPSTPAVTSQHGQQDQRPSLPAGKRKFDPKQLAAAAVIMSLLILRMVLRSRHNGMSGASNLVIAVCSFAGVGALVAVLLLLVRRKTAAATQAVLAQGMTWVLPTTVPSENYAAMGALTKAGKNDMPLPTLLCSDGVRLLIHPTNPGMMNGSGRPFEVPLRSIRNVTVSQRTTASDRARARQRISGPLLDNVTLHIAAPNGSEMLLSFLISSPKKAALLAAGPLRPLFAP